MSIQKPAILFKSENEVKVIKNYEEPNLDVAQLAHVEIFTPKPNETLKFFTDIIGMNVTAREGQSVFLRAYEDFYHSSLKITEAPQAGLGHAAWRTRTPQALMRRVKAITASGYGQGWIEGDLGHGAAYQFKTPDGHQMEIFFDVEYYQQPEDQKTLLLNRASKRPNIGVPVRRLDHINLFSSNVANDSEFLIENLGFRLTEKMATDDGSTLGTWLSLSNIVHEIAFMNDPTGGRGRLHHICYWYGVPQNLFDVADLCAENNIQIELGPRKHSISQAFCLYVYEPGGNRIELFGDAGYLIFDPTWEAPVWNDYETVSNRGLGSPFTETYWTYGTPNISALVES